MNETALLNLINTLIFQNGNRLITGTVLNSVLRAMYQYAQFNELDSAFTPVNATVGAGDSIFYAIEKLQGQINIAGGTSLSKSGVIFVDPVYGNDTTGAREDLSKPFQTLDAAILSGVSEDIIMLAAGTYSAPISNMFQNSYTYILEKGADVNISGSFAVNASENYAIIGEGTLRLTASAGIDSNFDGIFKIIADTIIMTSNATIIDTTSSLFSEIQITANSISSNRPALSIQGGAQLTANVNTFKSAGAAPSGLVAINSTSATTHNHSVKCETIVANLKFGGIIQVDSMPVADTLNVEIGYGKVILLGTPSVTDAIGILVMRTGSNGRITLTGDFDIDGICYIVNNGGSARIKAKGAIKHTTSLGNAPAISLTNDAKLSFTGVIIATINNTFIELNKVRYDLQAAGSCELELQNVNLKNLSNTSSASRVILKNGSAKLRLINVISQVSNVLWESVSTDSVGTENIEVYAAFTNGIIPANINNVIAGTSIITDPAVTILDFS